MDEQDNVSNNQNTSKYKAQQTGENIAKEAGASALKASGVPAPIANMAASKIASTSIAKKAGEVAASNPLLRGALSNITPAKQTGASSDENPEKEPIQGMMQKADQVKGLGQDGISNIVGGVTKALKNPLLRILITPPGVFIAGGVIAILAILLFVVLAAGGGDSFGGGPHLGPGLGYIKDADLCSSIRVHSNDNSSFNRTYELEEYVAAVVAAEVGGFNSLAVYETFAIAARTFVLKSHSNCAIDGTARKQAVNPDRVTDAITNAVQNTKGQVIVDNDGKLRLTQYDAFAWSKKENGYYYLSQKNHAIPIDWAESNVSNAYLNCTPSAKKTGNIHCSNHHGNGMSQYGALYLASEYNFTSEQILRFYYDNLSLSSIYAYNTNVKLSIQTTENTDELHISLESYLQSANSSIEDLNEYLFSQVRNNGVGTREGVVTAALISTSYLSQVYNIRLPYTYGGGHYIFKDLNPNFTDGVTYGFNKAYGSPIKAYYHSGYGPYYYFGPDCSGFVAWAIYNGGFTSVQNSSASFRTLGIDRGSSYLGLPGDLIYHPGHIMMIVGHDYVNEEYYIAHAKSGASGVVVEKMPFYKKGEYIIDMSNIYGDQKRVATGYPGRSVGV